MDVAVIVGDGVRRGVDVDNGKGRDVAVIAVSIVLVGMIGNVVVGGSVGSGAVTDDSIETVGIVVVLLAHPLPNIITNNSKTIFDLNMTTLHHYFIFFNRPMP
jgi:hypothetical protein